MKTRRALLSIAAALLAALRCDRIDAPWVLDGPINGESFRIYGPAGFPD